MKKFLPKTSNNPKGFTLVELLVVISIIAILSVIGITVFSNVQKSARDATRRADIDAIAKALEVNKATTGYVALNGNQFANGTIPQTDPQGFVYCGNTTLNTQPTGGLTAASSTTGCTPSGANNYSAISATIPVPSGGATSWKICTWLETAVNGSNSYCKSSAQ